MITLNTGSTKSAEEFFAENINKLGKVISVEHKRNGKKAEFETIITGELNAMTITGGLSSGYPGTGPNGFIRVLNELGMDVDTATELIKGNRDQVHSFRHVF